jgi:hypothetical protein
VEFRLDAFGWFMAVSVRVVMTGQILSRSPYTIQ